MKKQLFLLCLTILTINCYAQIIFEKGYYIDNTNQKVDCLIKNKDRRSNPTKFTYKLTESSKEEKATIKMVKEFGVYSISRYVSAKVKIDRSSPLLKDLSMVKDPILKEEELFLKVLVEGESNLYVYVDDNLVRYFYKVKNSAITQLIHKKYKSNETQIRSNNYYKSQLLKDLKCSDFNQGKIKRISYSRKDLMNLFVEHNECQGKVLTYFEKKIKKNLFNLTVRPRLNISSLSLRNPTSTYNFSNIAGFGFGVEAEVIFPFNKNKWSLIFEPTYQNFKSTTTVTAGPYAFYGDFITEADFNSIEVPLGVRHYFFLNEKSKLFVNASVVIDFTFNSIIKSHRENSTDPVPSPFEIKTRNNFAFGAGYNYNDKFNIEVRYQTKQEILSSYVVWSSDYQTISIILGYTLL